MYDADSDAIRLSTASLQEIVEKALIACGTAEAAAFSVAKALTAAEADGLVNHGIARAPSFCDSVAAGKVDGSAIPRVTRPRPGTIEVDAGHGFAHPAIEAGMDELVEAARINGIAIMRIGRAYSGHVMGYHTEELARRGVLALGFANSPASIAPPGGKRGILGTNPVSFSMRKADGAVIVVDQAASVIAKSEITDRSAAGEPLVAGWALDAEGKPTLSAAEALKGTMVPAGGYKGFNIALLVELLAAVTSDGALGIDAPPFADMQSGPMNLAQTFIALDVEPAAREKLATVLDTIEQEGGRVPGSRRFEARTRAEKEGVKLPKALYDRMLAYAPQGA